MCDIINEIEWDKYECPLCKCLLEDVVQVSCGHRLCLSCAEQLFIKSSTPQCPKRECAEPLTQVDGIYFFADQFIRREVAGLIVRCGNHEQGCSWRGRADELQGHLKFCDVLKKVPIIANLQWKVQQLEIALREKEDIITTLQDRVLQLEQAQKCKSSVNEDLNLRLSHIENSNFDGTMVWKVADVSQQMQDAREGKRTFINSMPFYAGRYGYKMCLRLHILGDGDGMGTHMSLYLVLMKGEFDKLLKWPFTFKVTFKLLNQLGGRDIVFEAIKPDPCSSSLQRPMKDLNVVAGCPCFVSLMVLRMSDDFLANDTLFFKVEVDTRNIKHP